MDRRFLAAQEMMKCVSACQTAVRKKGGRNRSILDTFFSKAFNGIIAAFSVKGEITRPN